MGDNRAFTKFLESLIIRKKILPGQLAKELGISNSSMSRWLSGHNLPRIKSCRKLATFADVPLEDIFTAAGFSPRIIEIHVSALPAINNYTIESNNNDVNDDLITMLQDIIKHQRLKRSASEKSKIIF